ncbi:MAG: hypothetical protein Q8R60_00110 [Mycobacteriales bacterium]|nr:hypothetical protein [Mycobacteriales bacterium]
MAARREPEGHRPGALVVVALIALADSLLVLLLAGALLTGRPLVSAVLLAVLLAVALAGALRAVAVAVGALLAVRAGRHPRPARPVVVVAEQSTPESDPAFGPAARRREVGVDLAEARLEAARRRGAPLGEVLTLSVALRRARLDHAEALLAAGADLPGDLLVDLAERGAGPLPPYPREEPQIQRRRVDQRASEAP